MFKNVNESASACFSRTGSSTRSRRPDGALAGHACPRERGQKLLRILLAGRQAGDFERKTPLDRNRHGDLPVMRPYLNPLLLQYSFDYTDQAPGQLSSLVLRSLSP